MHKFAATALILFTTLPASAQKIPPINLMRGDSAPDAYTQQRRKQIENEYNATMKKIPDRPKQSSDPWNKMRGANETKGQTTK